MFGSRSFGLTPSVPDEDGDDGPCAGGFGSGGFGQDDFGGVECSEGSSLPTTRPDCGGMFGTGTFGQRYFAGHIQCSPDLPTTRPDCGGMFGTGSFGQRYFAGHYQCNPVLPTTRPDCGGMFGTGAFGMRYFAGHIQCGEVPPPPPAPTRRVQKGYANKRRPKQEDLDDLIFIIMLWQGVRTQPTTATASLPPRA